jgi:hypothetical protein
MIDLAINADIESKVPDVTVGWITAIVRNTRHDEALWAALRLP